MPAIPISEPRSFNDLYYFITVREPVLNHHEFVKSFFSDYDAYACHCYYQHLKITFEMLAFAAEIDALNLDANQKATLKDLALKGKAFIDVINEINQQSTVWGKITLPPLAYKFTDQQSTQCLHILENINSIIRLNPNNPQHNQQLRTHMANLNTELNNLSNQFKTTPLDVLNVTASAFIGVATTAVGLGFAAIAAFSLFALPILIVSAHSGLALLFLASAVISVHTIDMLIPRGISTLGKCFCFFKKSEKIDSLNASLQSEDTYHTITTLRQRIARNHNDNLEYFREALDVNTDRFTADTTHRFTAAPR
jgi:hypothetical protein